MRDVALEAMDDDVAVVEEVRSSDLSSSDEDLRGVSGGSQSQAPADENALDFGAEHQFFEVVERIEAGDGVLLKEERD